MSARPAQVGTADRRSRSIVLTILIVGDSLTVQSYDDLEELFGATDDQFVILAENGKGIRRAIPVVRAWPTADVVVIALGTNDVASAPPVIEDLVTEVLDGVAPDADLYWVDVYLADGRGAAVNDVLSHVAERTGHLQILEWSALARTTPGLLDADGIHLTTEGRRARAALVANAVRRTASGT